MTEVETGGGRRFSWPADYYSAPASEPIVPVWAVRGCGGAALLALVLLFAGGAFLASGGFVDLMDLVLGMSVGEMKGMYGADVTAGQKAALESEIETMREGLRSGRVSVAALQPFLETLRTASGDSRITAEEAGRLRDAARTINSRRPAIQPLDRKPAAAR